VLMLIFADQIVNDSQRSSYKFNWYIYVDS